VAAWEDLADLANVAVRDAFGEEVVYTPVGGSPVALTAPFDAAHEVLEVGGEVPVSTVRPVLDVRLADLPAAPQKKDEVRVRGVDYVVDIVQPGGHGTAKLVLTRA
jgi:hypothetical protein